MVKRRRLATKTLEICSSGGWAAAAPGTSKFDSTLQHRHRPHLVEEADEEKREGEQEREDGDADNEVVALFVAAEQRDVPDEALVEQRAKHNDGKEDLQQPQDRLGMQEEAHGLKLAAGRRALVLEEGGSDTH